MAKDRMNSTYELPSPLFMQEVTKSLMENNHMRAKRLSCLLDMATIINIPRNEEEANKLKWVCDTYDDLIDDINNEMKRVKERVNRMR